jgi:hypothetical protein
MASYQLNIDNVPIAFRHVKICLDSVRNGTSPEDCTAGGFLICNRNKQPFLVFPIRHDVQPVANLRFNRMAVNLMVLATFRQSFRENSLKNGLLPVTTGSINPQRFLMSFQDF